jgi:uncharacterized protein (DUF433 family)
MKSEVASVPGVMSGEPVIVGTRILAKTILSYVRAGAMPSEISKAYPSLPADGVEAVIRWAEMTYGPEWKSKIGLAIEAKSTGELTDEEMGQIRAARTPAEHDYDYED